MCVATAMFTCFQQTETTNMSIYMHRNHLCGCWAALDELSVSVEVKGREHHFVRTTIKLPSHRHMLTKTLVILLEGSEATWIYIYLDIISRDVRLPHTNQVSSVELLSCLSCRAPEPLPCHPSCISCAWVSSWISGVCFHKLHPVVSGRTHETILGASGWFRWDQLSKIYSVCFGWK